MYSKNSFMVSSSASEGLEVIHALWKSDGHEGLYLWIESSKLLNHPKKANYHPFAYEHIDLLRWITTYTPYQSSEKWAQTLILSLPHNPYTSAPHASWDDCSYHEAKLSHWQVPSFYIPKNKALEMLDLLSATQSSYRKGSSLAYWSTISSFVEELIKKGAFYPSTEPVGDAKSTQVIWKPLLDGALHSYKQKLSEAMPALCSSYALTQYTSSFLIDHFIEYTLNVFLKKLFKDLPENDRAPFDNFLTSFFDEDKKLNDAGLSEEQSAQLTLTKEREVTIPLLHKKQFKLMFQLQPPHVSLEKWTLIFLIQSVENPSLIFSAASLWENSYELLENYEDPQDRLLQDLLRVAQKAPRFMHSLEQKFPTHLFLSTHEVYHFLIHEMDLLVAEGFSVQLPRKWDRVPKRIQSQLSFKRLSNTNSLSKETILNYDWKISLGDHTLTEKEFTKLLALKEPLVHLQGEWILLDSSDLSKMQALLSSKEKSFSLSQALRTALSSDDSLFPLPVESVTHEQWFEELKTTLQSPQQITPVATPSSFQGVLRPYQERGLSWLSYVRELRLGACLADDMGLGKTIQIIALMLYEKETKGSKKPYLLICPLSVLSTWQAELSRFAPSLKVMVHHSSTRLSKEAFKKKALENDLVITTYGLTVKDHQELLSLEWYSIILDEAHTIKNYTSKQTRAIKALYSESNIALTGTPLENRLSELWSLMDFLNKGYLGPKQQFHKQFIIPIEQQTSEERAYTLKKIVQPFMLRRLKTDSTVIQDLPEKIETKELCYLTKEQAVLYQSVLNSMLVSLDESRGIERKGLILSTLMKLKQICNHPAQFIKDNSSLEKRSGKCARLEELLEEILEKKEKSLIFTQFAAMGKLLQKHLSKQYKQEVLFLFGGTHHKTRKALLERFQEPDGPSIFILSLKAGGTGLNLTQATHVFHFDRWWNPAVENQATDRAFRIGQKKVVHVHKLLCAGTVEEHIDSLIEHKKNLTNLVLSQGDQWITELSTKELKDLLSFTL